MPVISFPSGGLGLIRKLQLQSATMLDDALLPSLKFP